MIFMSNATNIHARDYGQFLYLFPFVIFYSLLTMRNSATYGYIFELLPVLGRTMPYLCLDILLVGVFKYRGGSLKQLGLCWPESDKTKFKMIIWIVVGAIVVLAMRILIGVSLGPLLEFLPPKISRTNDLAGNLTLLISILPLMWVVVIGEEVLTRGLLMNYLAKIFGDTTKAWLLAIVISAVVFGLCHMGKGPAAAISSGFGGLVYGLGYFIFRKNLWPVILAHCSGNTIAFVGVYFDN